MSEPSHQWFYVADGLLGTTNDVGPISEIEILNLARKGKIKRETLVRSPSRTNGGLLPAHGIPGLLRAIEVGEREREEQKQADAEEKLAKQAAKAAERQARLEQQAAERQAREDERARQRALVIQQQQSIADIPPALPMPISPHPQYAYPPQVNIQIQQPSQAAHSLGIGSVILGILSFFICWMPFIGLFFGGLGLLLGVIGIVLAVTRQGTGVGFSIAGSAISSVATVVGLFYMLVFMGIAGTAADVASDGEGKSNRRAGFDSPMVGARSGAGEEELAKQHYISNHLVLYEVEAKYYDTFLDKRVPGIQFKIRNNGDRQLDRVEVTAYFKDSSGTVIYEDTYLPVLVTEFSFGDNKPLKPGHIWQIERGKFYTAESVPTEWAEGAVDVAVSDIRFSEESK